MDVQKRMPEAEVSLRLAFHLIENRLVESDVQVAIDGAQVRTTNTVHFGIAEFLRILSWVKPVTDDVWQGIYSHISHIPKVVIHSKSGCGDVVAKLTDGRTLRVECKKGPLSRSKSSQEYPLLREALGQLLTMESVGDQDVLAVAVPSSPKFEELAKRWRRAPLVSRFNIRILTVGRENEVLGLSDNAQGE